MNKLNLPNNWSNLCLHQLFEKQSESSPGCVALVHGGIELTYDELNRRANRLAHYLRSCGVGPEARVAICLERSPDLIVAIIGTLKAGAGYVPLETRWPEERLGFLLADSRPSVLITEKPFEGLPSHLCDRVIYLAQDRAVIDQFGESNPPQVATPDNIAYAIYTSGSTGKPKGVTVTHRNLVRLFAAAQPSFNFGPNDVWTMFHSPAFDFSVWELWGSLLFGGRLILVSYTDSRATDNFYQLLSAQRVTILNQTPTAFRELQAVDDARRLPLALRCVIFGGEALNPPMLAPWFYRHREIKLINMYGITEVTVHATYRLLDSEDLQRQRSVIGTSLPDLRLYLLDEQLRPVVESDEGELYVAGPGLARGYLNRPGWTAAQFVADPFSGQPGSRMYRTGDRGRWTSESELEFIGRADNQIKIRGHRIELGEIENLLQQCPEVRDVVVVAREDTPQEKVLVAYLTAASGSFDEAEVRAYAGRVLPEYMRPVSYVPLASLPVTPNGKLNREALPAPAGLRPELTQGYVAPRTVLEETLCGIWSRVLRMSPVGVEDDFFEFGGHSLLATQLASQVREVTGVPIELRHIFEASTVTALSEIIEDEYRQREASDNALVDEIERLSPEEVQLLLSKQEPS